MKKYRLLCLLLAIFGMSVLIVCDVNAATVKKAAPAKPKKLTKAQQAEQARRAAEVQAKAEAEAKAKAKAAQEAEAKAEAGAKARAEAEAKARAEAEARAKREAEIAAREKSITDAEALMKDGKPAEAYALLEPLEFERSGEVRFDYLLGIAALDSGKPDKATLAFERVLAVDPNFAGARLDMARAYYQLGDLPRAQTEFQTVLTQNPPEAAKATIQKYLAAIQAQQEAKKTRITGYFEEMVGRDTNINNSTNQAQIAVPAFGNLVFTLNPSNVQTASNYESLAAGMEVNHLLNANVALYAGADVRQRGNVKMKAFDFLSVDERAGLSFATGAEAFRVGVLANQYTLESTYNRDTAGINAEWRHTFSPSNQLNAFAQSSQNRFMDAVMKVNDFDQSILGVGWQHVMADGKSALFGSLYYGHENDVAPVTVFNPGGGRADGNKSFNGLRIGGQASVRDNMELFASLGTQHGGYDKFNAAFMQTRIDTMDDLSAGLNWHTDKFWTIRPQVAWSRNKSNIVIYGFDRTDYSVTVRRDFK